jgi:hypothetical protein
MISALATISVLLGYVASAAPARSQDQCKTCREDYLACTQAHSKDACKANYDICLKHCRKK